MLQQGILIISKALSRKILVTSVIAKSDNFQYINIFSKSVNVLDAVLWFADA